MTAATPTQRIGATAPLKLKYFDLSGAGGLAGRGGALRFFLLATGIDFEEDKVKLDQTWGDVKQQLIASGKSCQGYLPVVTLNGKDLTECHALMRRFSKQLGLYGDDVEKDYIIDALADATVSWRWHWVSGSFEGTKETYVSSQRAGHYSAFEKLLTEHNASGAYTVAGGKLTFADALVFGQVWDDCGVCDADAELLKAHPRLLAFCKAFIAQPAVGAWCQAANSAVAAAISGTAV